jgi:hypothetical protein
VVPGEIEGLLLLRPQRQCPITDESGKRVRPPFSEGRKYNLAVRVVRLKQDLMGKLI